MTERVLVVDDDEFVRVLMEEVLGQCGYAVSCAEDGQAAWEMIERDPASHDLVLLDKQMPRLDGLSLLRRIRGDGRFVDLPVIMLTADNSPEDVSEGLAAGAHYYLTKPSSEDVLKVVIKSALAESRQKRELRALAGRHAGSLGLLCRAEFRCRTLAEARDLALLLADASMDPARTVVGYSELLINAVEHGNLGISYADKSRLLGEGCWIEEVEQRLRSPEYADRVVTVMLEKADGSSRVTIVDQGPGFDWRSYLEFSPERVFDLHGRGIAMSKSVSFDSLEYLGRGNAVVATVRLPDDKG
ncbi:MAG: response regulator [Rhodocyclales bacterium]|nr:response regulator [Rhodocyclales bacterium]